MVGRRSSTSSPGAPGQGSRGESARPNRYSRASRSRPPPDDARAPAAGSSRSTIRNRSRTTCASSVIDHAGSPRCARIASTTPDWSSSARAIRGRPRRPRSPRLHRSRGGHRRPRDEPRGSTLSRRSPPGGRPNRPAGRAGRPARAPLPRSRTRSRGWQWSSSCQPTPARSARHAAALAQRTPSVRSCRPCPEPTPPTMRRCG